MKERYEPELVESVSVILLEDCSPEGFTRLVQSKLQYIPQWKEGPEKVLGVMTKAAEDWALVDIEVQDHAIAERKPTSGSSSEKKAKKTAGKHYEERPKTPIICFGCLEQGHALRLSRQGKAGERQRWW